MSVIQKSGEELEKEEKAESFITSIIVDANKVRDYMKGENTNVDLKSTIKNLQHSINLLEDTLLPFEFPVDKVKQLVDEDVKETESRPPTQEELLKSYGLDNEHHNLLIESCRKVEEEFNKKYSNSYTKQTSKHTNWYHFTVYKEEDRKKMSDILVKLYNYLEVDVDSIDAWFIPQYYNGITYSFDDFTQHILSVASILQINVNCISEEIHLMDRGTCLERFDETSVLEREIEMREKMLTSLKSEEKYSHSYRCQTQIEQEEEQIAMLKANLLILKS